ncbi:MAG: glycosyltransferase, partial [Verrucomicrobiota bacterium]|nr:glycosyltransferase [Verrucomicrobiota bacterium]
MVYIVEAKAAKCQIVKRQVTELHEQYLHKAAGSRLIDDKPHPDLRIVVVIPCHNEPDLIGALEHLTNCKPPLCHAEVIVVVNGSANNLPAVHQQNQRTLDQAADWLARQINRWLPIHLLNFPNMPSK